MEFLNMGCNVVVKGKNGKYSRDDVLNCLSIYRQLQIRHVEFSYVLDFDLRDAECIRKYMKKIGLQAWSVHTLTLDGDMEEMLKVQQLCAKTADALDARIMVCHLPSPDVNGVYSIQRIQAAADVAREFGVGLAIETPNYKEIIGIVDRISRADVGINIDTGHSFLHDSKDVAGVFHAVGNRLMTVHIHDNYGFHDDHQMPGLGLIDWRSVMAALKESQYNGPLMLEMSDMDNLNRTVPQLARMTVEQEIAGASAWFKWLWNEV